MSVSNSELPVSVWRFLNSALSLIVEAVSVEAQLSISETMLDTIKKRIEELSRMEPEKVEIRTPPRRNNSTTYISLSPIGVKPSDKIIVVTFENAMVVMKAFVNGVK